MKTLVVYKKLPFVTLVALFLIQLSSINAQGFVHPGLLNTKESIDRMKGYIASNTEPAIAAFQSLQASKLAKADYKLAGPYETVARDGKFARTKGGSENDMSAAYYNALMYHLTGNRSNADKAVQIINAYAATLNSLDGHDAPLCCLQGFMLVNACELMRDEIDNNAVKQMLFRSFVPVIDKFEANSPYANGNWGAIVNKMRMAIAIYTDNREMYDAAKSYYLGGMAYGNKGFQGASDNGMLPYYISETGQCQETGRDQGHAQLGVGTLAETCEMAWNQGDDLWGALDNRLLKGYEYMAKYNLGYDVPFTQWTDCTGLYNDWKEPGQMSRGKFSTIYEIAYNHYVGRKGLTMPYTSMVLGKAGGVRVEGMMNGADRACVGSLIFYQGTKVDMKSSAPGGKESPKMHKTFTYAAPAGAPLKHDYDVYIQPRGEKEWTKIDTYMARVNAAPKHKVSEISYAYFDFVGDVYIKVVCKNKKFKTARVRPDYRGVICNIKNDSTVQFLLFQPENVSVEFDEDYTDNLLIFTSHPTIDMKQAKAEAKAAKRKFIYYAPGLYEEKKIKVPSNTTLYLAPGSYFTGTFCIEDAENVSILGRGVARPVDGYEGCHVHRSKNVLIDGLILNTCPVGGSDGVMLHDVRSISHPGWGDGLNVFASSNVTYDRVFCRNSDDCTTAYATRKGFSGSVYNIIMKNSTLWADVAHPIMIGLHGAGSKSEKSDSIVGLRYENIDIICQSEPQIDYQGCIGINCGDNNVVKDLVFDNIRIEDILQGSICHIKTCYNSKYCSAPGKSVENVLFRNIRYYGKQPGMSIIAGYDEAHKVKDITFEGLRINGRKISDNMKGKPGWYKTTDMADFYVNDHVENIIFK